MTTRIAIESTIAANGNNAILKGHWLITADTHTWDDTGKWIDTRIWDDGLTPELPSDLPYYL